MWKENEKINFSDDAVEVGTMGTVKQRDYLEIDEKKINRETEIEVCKRKIKLKILRYSS